MARLLVTNCWVNKTQGSKQRLFSGRRTFVVVQHGTLESCAEAIRLFKLDSDAQSELQSLQSFDKACCSGTANTSLHISPSFCFPTLTYDSTASANFVLK